MKRTLNITLRISIFLIFMVSLAVFLLDRFVMMHYGTYRFAVAAMRLGLLFPVYASYLLKCFFCWLAVVLVAALLLFFPMASVSLHVRTRRIPLSPAGIFFVLAALLLWKPLYAWERPILSYLQFRSSKPWYEQYQSVAHAMGTVDGLAYTNTREAFLENYALGQRVFEVDLETAGDGTTVCAHDWEWSATLQGFPVGYAPTAEEFTDALVYGTYHAMTFEDLLGIMQEYPDVYIVTDSKYADTEHILPQFRDMVERARALQCEAVLDRVIVQIYFEDMLETVRSVYDFDHYLFTVYQRGFRGKADLIALTEYCAENGVDGITLWSTLWEEDFRAYTDAYDVAVFAHTVNDMEEAENLMRQGVTGIYTDELVLPMQETGT